MLAKIESFQLTCEQLAQLRKFWVNHEMPSGPVFDIADTVDKEFPPRNTLPQLGCAPHEPANKLG